MGNIVEVLFSLISGSGRVFNNSKDTGFNAIGIRPDILDNMEATLSAIQLELDKPEFIEEYGTYGVSFSPARVRKTLVTDKQGNDNVVEQQLDNMISVFYKKPDSVESLMSGFKKAK